MHTIELAAIFHHKIAHIHPFFDGNGRTARLVMNVILMRKGYPLVVILKNDRKKYYRALEKADKGDYAPFVRFIAQAVERSMAIYLNALLPIKGKGDKFYPLSIISKQTPYSEKYLNLLARKGKIEAHKEKRNWVTSLEAVKRYQAARQRKRK
ncbi:MAG: Fic family protein [Candidatus Saganbacteria bacterium]|nr:Fic family protein [Candidatus Saganbacteria bacterium]